MNIRYIRPLLYVQVSKTNFALSGGGANELASGAVLGGMV